MDYKSIRQTINMSRSTEKPTDAAQREYESRVNGWSTFRSGITFDGHEMFAVCFRELGTALDTVRELEGSVESLWNDLPNIAKRAYLFDLIGAEVQSTNTIEGVHTTRKEIADALESAAGEGPHKRLTEFAKLFLGLSGEDGEQLELPHELKDIRNIYDQVTDGEIADKDKPDGILFRKGTVSVWDDGNGRKLHDGAYPESEIQVQLTKWITLLTDSNIPPVLRAVMCHYAFEYVHPFYDGNGRTGRYLLALYLNHDLTMPTVLSLSRTIAENKNAYYKAFMEAEDKLNCGELTLFVNTILGFIQQAQDELIDELSIKVDQLDKGRILCTQLEKRHALSRNAVSVLYGVIQEELFDSSKSMSLDEVAHHIGLSKQSARKYVEELLAAGLVVQTGKRPLKIQVAKSLRNVLATGADENAEA